MLRPFLGNAILEGSATLEGLDLASLPGSSEDVVLG